MTESQSGLHADSFNQHVHAQLRHLRNEIAHGVHRPDGYTLAKRLTDLGISVPPEDLQWFVAELLRGMSSQGEHFVPPAVLEVVRGLLKGTRANLAVDPWAGVGVLAAVVKEASEARTTIAYTTSPGTLSLAKALAPQLDWRLAKITEPLASLEQLADIDVAACIPPMGMKAPKPIEVGIPGGPTVSTRDVGQAILVACGVKLSSDGRALFVLPASVFFSSNSILPQLPLLGLGVEAALELPAGSFAPYANVSAYLVVVRRALLAKVFVAQLSQDAHTNRQILANFRDRKADGAIDMGRLVAVDEFRGFSALKLAERLQQAEQRFGASAVRLADLAVRMTLGRPTDGFTFPPTDNGVYVPLVGISDVVTSTDEMKLKVQNYAQIAIDPNHSDFRFVARFLNSELGRAIREASKSGSTIPKLNSTGLQELRVFVPPLAAQQQMLDLTARISAETNTVRSLHSELADLNRDLWTAPTELDRIDSRLREFSKRMQVGATTHAAATLEQWFESLPFPLASILRAWQATQGKDHKTKQEHLLHFFEATAEFLSIIYLSAFASRPELFADHKQKLNAAWGKQHLTLERATFGTWKVAVEYFGKQTRILAGGDQESRTLCKELFADESLPQMLASKNIPAVVSATNKMRNDWSGHGGVVSQAEASLRNQLLVTELHKLREAMSDTWSHVQLVRAMGCQPRRGVFENEIAVMMGSNSEFLTESRTMSTWLDVERLYIVSRHSGRALVMLPLVNVGPSPASAKNACYFFNRVEKEGLRFVSYHFADQPERKEQFDEAAATIRFLTEVTPGDDH